MAATTPSRAVHPLLDQEVSKVADVSIMVFPVSDPVFLTLSAALLMLASVDFMAAASTMMACFFHEVLQTGRAKPMMLQYFSELAWPLLISRFASTFRSFISNLFWPAFFDVIKKVCSNFGMNKSYSYT